MFSLSLSLSSLHPIWPLLPLCPNKVTARQDPVGMDHPVGKLPQDRPFQLTNNHRHRRMLPVFLMLRVDLFQRWPQSALAASWYIQRMIFLWWVVEWNFNRRVSSIHLLYSSSYLSPNHLSFMQCSTCRYGTSLPPWTADTFSYVVRVVFNDFHTFSGFSVGSCLNKGEATESMEVTKIQPGLHN